MTNPLYRDMANTDFMTELKNRNSYETDRQNLDAKKKCIVVQLSRQKSKLFIMN